MSLIQLRRSAVAAKVPTTAQLSLGELAINTFDGKIFLKKDNGTPSIVEIGAVPFASPAEALAGTSTILAMSPATTKQAIDALADTSFNTMVVKATSSTFTVPPGVTQILAFVVGGGGGGGRRASVDGGDGGSGGVGMQLFTVAPGAVLPATIGAAGAGALSGTGGAGGTTTFNGITSGGGTGGSQTGTNGNAGTSNAAVPLAKRESLHIALAAMLASNDLITVRTRLATQGNLRTVASTAAAVYSGWGDAFGPGVGGNGGNATISIYGSGGVGGAVIIFYRS